jgi:chitosanase
MSIGTHLNLRTELIPSGKKNRPGTKITPTSITIHNTDNTDAGADASAHSRFVRNTGFYERNGRKNWVSWHFTVDDKVAIKHLPTDERAFHAGSGNGVSIAIEICMHRGIDQAAANERAALLTAILLRDLRIKIDDVVPHQKWTGKNCPRLLLDSGRPRDTWEAFIDRVRAHLANLTTGAEAVALARMPALGVADDPVPDPDGEIDHEMMRAQLTAQAEAEAPPFMPLAALSETEAATRDTIDLTPAQRRVCERVINVYETGTITGKYGAISIFRDGPNRMRQITYGRAQTTEYSNLRELVQMYADAGGRFSEDLRSFVPRIGLTPLVDDETFKSLLRRAGNDDPVMRETQDEFFDRVYFRPAAQWAVDNGFTRALSMLVIYDSFIHSGSVRSFLRSRFPELPPARGGDEQTWIRQYVEVRHRWLANHDNPELHPTIYRTRDFAREIARGNWDLVLLPYVANGVPVYDRPTGPAPVAAAEAITFLGDPIVSDRAAGEDIEEVWCEEQPAESPAAFGAEAAMAAAAEDAATLASRILANPRIDLATEHVSGVHDDATAKQNIADTAAGSKAHRSSYGNAPGGTIALDRRMLRGLVALGEQYRFAVSELCGASHSRNSRHYAGIAADFNRLNGQPIRAGHPDVAAFMQRCRSLGATEVLGPGSRGHDTHVHAAWPRT